MRIKEIKLSPGLPLKLPMGIASVAMVGGSIPFLNLRTPNGKKVRLNIGQCLPVTGSFVMENPFQNPAVIEVAYNAPLNFTYMDYGGYNFLEVRDVVYRAGVELLDQGDGKTAGFALIQREGNALLNCAKVGGSVHRVYIGRSKTAAEYEAYLSGIWGAPDSDLKHLSNAVNERTAMYSGSAVSNETIISDLGLELISGNGSDTQTLTKGAAFFVLADPTKNIFCNVRVMDLGLD